LPPKQQKSPSSSSGTKRAFTTSRSLTAAATAAAFHFARPLLAIALAGERFFRATLLTWLQVKGMPLNLFHNVLLLDFAFEAAQRTFKSFAVLYVDLCQRTSPPSESFYYSRSVDISTACYSEKFKPAWKL
jgi:hypothetical protein